MQNEFTQVDFGPIQEYLDNDDITDISYSNGGQIWLKTLSKGVYRIENPAVNNAFMEKMAFQCANSMGKSFNMANPFLDAESDELRMNFVHDSIARNGIAVLIRKTPAKIRLEKDKIIKEDYIRLDIHDFILRCVEGHCNILVSGETGSGKTEFVKYMAAHTKYDEKLITIEDTLELHLDKIFPERDIVAMKTNNIASYADVLVTCMRQNPRWILLSEVRSAEAVMAVRDSISSGHNILSTIHADKAESIPSRLYSLLESSIDMDQFLRSIHRYVQLGVHIKGYYSKELQRFKREVAEVVEFYVDEDNQPGYNILYKRTPEGKTVLRNPTKYLLSYLESQGVIMEPDILVKEQFKEAVDEENVNEENADEEILSSDSVSEVKTPSQNDMSFVTSSDSVTVVPLQNPNITSGNVGVTTASVQPTPTANVSPTVSTPVMGSSNVVPVTSGNVVSATAPIQSVQPTPTANVSPSVGQNNVTSVPSQAVNTVNAPVQNAGVVTNANSVTSPVQNQNNAVNVANSGIVTSGNVGVATVPVQATNVATGVNQMVQSPNPVAPQTATVIGGQPSAVVGNQAYTGVISQNVAA